MPDPSDPVAFRRSATGIFRKVMIGLAALALACVLLGWLMGGLWGLILGTAVGAVVAGGGAVAATLIWAMTQDGA